MAADALARLAREIVARIDMEAITEAIAALPAAPLIAELDGLVAAVVCATPESVSRSVGVVGRLLGRDLIALAHPDPIDGRVRLHLGAAATQAARIEMHLATLQATLRHLDEQTAMLDGTLRQARLMTQAHAIGEDPSIASDITYQRRADYLQATADSWRAVHAHIAMTLEFGQSVLDRHAQARDVLVPLWRQHAAAAALGSHLTSPEAIRLRSIGETLRVQIRAPSASQPTHIPQIPQLPSESAP